MPGAYSNQESLGTRQPPIGKSPLQYPASNSIRRASHGPNRHKPAEEGGNDVELEAARRIRDGNQIVGQIGQRELATDYRRRVVEDHAAIPVSQQPDQQSIKL